MKPIPSGLEEVLLWCLAKDPDERPISAEALYDRLHALDGIGAWGREEASAWWKDYRVFTQNRSFDGSEGETRTLG